MELGFNPALEQQAVGRVHQLGQKCEVEVICLLVKTSIETRIGTFLEKKHDTPANDDIKEEKDSPVAACGVGNIEMKKPKSKILAEEFNILFGVEDNNSLKPIGKREKKEQKRDNVVFKCTALAKQSTEDEDMPAAVISSQSI